MKTVIFAKDVNLSKLVEMLKICPCCKYVSNLYQTITFTSLLRINTFLANICIWPLFSRQRKCNANLELQIYHIFAPFANSKSVLWSELVKAFSHATIPVRMVNPSAQTVTIFRGTKRADFERVDNDLATFDIGKNSPSADAQHNSSDDLQQPKDYSEFPDLSNSILSDDEKVELKNLFNIVMLLLFLGISCVEHPLCSMSLILAMLRLLSKGRLEYFLMLRKRLTVRWTKCSKMK